MEDDSVKMEVTRISVDTACYGPLEFILTGKCGVCRKEFQFKIAATLLPSREVACPACGHGNNYIYDSGKSGNYSGSEGGEIEAYVLKRIESSPEDSIRALGRNILFPVFSYFANRLRQD